MALRKYRSEKGRERKKPLGDKKMVEVEGIRVTSLQRTVKPALVFVVVVVIVV